MRALDKLDKATQWLTVGLLGATTLIVFLQVIFRYIIRRPLFWATELSTYMFIWFSFLGISVGVKRKAHFNVDFLVIHFPKKLRKAIELCMDILVIAFLAIAIIAGIKLMVNTTGQCSPSMHIPMPYIYSVIPISCFSMIVYYVEEFMRNFRKKR